MPIHPVSICRVTIVSLKNVWQEKQGTRRSCITTISVSTTCRLNYFRKWRPFESRAVSAVSRTTRRDKQKFGDTREKTRNIGSRFIMRQLHRSTTNCVSCNTILANASTILHELTRLARQRKKYIPLISRKVMISDTLITRLSRISRDSIFDCPVIGRISSDGKVLIHHSRPHVCVCTVLSSKATHAGSNYTL